MSGRLWVCTRDVCVTVLRSHVPLSILRTLQSILIRAGRTTLPERLQYEYGRSIYSDEEMPDVCPCPRTWEDSGGGVDGQGRSEGGPSAGQSARVRCARFAYVHNRMSASRSPQLSISCLSVSQERAMSVAVLPRLCWRSASSSLCAAGRGRTAWTAWTMSDVATWTLDERLEQWLPCPLFLLLLLHLLLSPSQCPAAER